MASLWQWRLMLAVPLLAATNANRDALAQVFVDNGSGESLANEKLMFASAVKLAFVATPLVQAGWGLSFPVKLAMRDGLTTAIGTINSGLTAINRIQWYLVNADANENVLVNSSRASVAGRIGTVFSYQDALTDLGLAVMEN